MRKFSVGLLIWGVSWVALGAGERTETHIFGDSIFTTSNRRIQGRLQELAQKPIFDHSVAGATMAQIQQQYANFRQAPIQTVILDGGGNDILGQRNVCQNQLPEACKATIRRVADVMRATIETMAEDGVEELVLLSCHYPVGWNNGFQAAVDYAFPLLKELCDESPIPCRLVDPRASFNNRNDLFEWDGVHPNWNGSTVMAELIWDVMRN